MTRGTISHVFMKLKINKNLRALFLANTLFAFADFLIVPTYSLFITSTGASVETAGILWGVRFFVSALVSLIIANMKNTKGLNAVFLQLFYFIRGGAWMLLIFFDDIYMLFLVQIILGISEPIGSPAFNSLVSDQLDDSNKLANWASWQFMFGVAIGISNILSGYILSSFGFKILFFTVAFFSFAALGLFSLHLEYGKNKNMRMLAHKLDAHVLKSKNRVIYVLLGLALVSTGFVYVLGNIQQARFTQSLVSNQQSQEQSAMSVVYTDTIETNTQLPRGLVYECLPNNKVKLSWQSAEGSNAYSVYVDNTQDTWSGCPLPDMQDCVEDTLHKECVISATGDRCITVNYNVSVAYPTFRITEYTTDILGGSIYKWWVRSHNDVFENGLSDAVEGPTIRCD